MFFSIKLRVGLITLLLPLRYFSKEKKSIATLKYLQKQWSDEFSRKAREHSYRARSAYKLLEINEKYKIIKPGEFDLVIDKLIRSIKIAEERWREEKAIIQSMVIVDVGAAPGSWCQVAVDIVQPNVYSSAFVLGIDLKPIVPILGVHFLDLSDITAQKTHESIKQLLNGRSVDVVISDMAPNPTGDGGIDHERILSLCATVLELSMKKLVIPLVKNGTLLCKIWDGPKRDEFIERLKKDFRRVYTVKPKASRDHSAEIYLLAIKKLF